MNRRIETMSREMKHSGIEWIGEIPKGWGCLTLKRLLKQPLQYGANESGIPYDESLPRYIRITDIRNNSLRDDIQKQSLSEEQAEGYILCDNDILFARSGATVGKSFFYNKIYGRCAFAGYLIKASISSLYYSKFVFYYTQSAAYDEWKRRVFIQSTIQNIGADKYSLMEIPIPPFFEQQKIANYLDRVCGEVDEMIALQEQMIEELKAYKQSVITEAVTKGLNPNVPMKDSGINWIGKVPEGWKVCRIKDLVETRSGSNLTTEEITTEGLYPVYGGNGIRGYYSEYSNDGEFILIGRQGALCGNINYASGKFWVTEHAVVCYPKREFKLRWLGELLRAMNLGQYSLSAAQPGLAAERIKVLKMPLPPIEEQQSIASYLDTKCAEIDDLIAIKESKIEELKEYKKSVIYEYVTGKKEVV